MLSICKCSRYPRHPRSFPTRRSSDLSLRARLQKTLLRLRDGLWGGGTRVKRLRGIGRPVYEARTDSGEDRKSTRLNSSHSQISYAVFCLKKKTTRSIATVASTAAPSL